MNDAAVTPSGGTGGNRFLHRVIPVAAVAVAGALQLVVGWFTAASGLLAPLWAIVVLGLIWAVAVVVLVRMARRRPIATPLVPVANAFLWWATMTAGETWLGWTP